MKWIKDKLKAAGIPVSDEIGTFVNTGELYRLDDPKDWGKTTYRWEPDDGSSYEHIFKNIAEDEPECHQVIEQLTSKEK